MRGQTLPRVVLLLFGLALSSTLTFCQALSCATLQGNWDWYYDGSEYDLSQDGSGNITGELSTPFCPGQQFPITGTITSGSFTFTATNLNSCPGTTNAWTTFTGYVGQPGCNFAYGTWNNSLGNSGGFGEDDPYPTDSVYFAKAVDVPTSETSVPPPPAAWNTLHGAPWNQTLIPNSPPSEFKGRGVYEYVGGTGSDSCWFAQSRFAPFTAITGPGHGWYVTSRNTWGADFIGWKLATVQYYRAQTRVPCGTRFPQQMVIDAAYSPENPSNYGPYTDDHGDNFYGVPYEVNTLGGDITATTVTSVRNGQVATNTTWK